MKKILFIFFCCVLFYSCIETGLPVKVSPALESPSVEQSLAVTNLFTIKGVTIYRFYDKGEYHYFILSDKGEMINTFQERYEGEDVPTSKWNDSAVKVWSNDRGF